MEKNDIEQGNMKIYEIGYLIVPTVAEENVGKDVETVKSLLESKGAAFITEDFPKMRPLAYEMTQVIGSKHSKFDKAYFGWIKFEMTPNAVPVVKAELDKNERILRSMVIETVRENTMVSQKVVYRPGDKTVKPGESTAPVSEAELDKTIATLVAE